MAFPFCLPKKASTLTLEEVDFSSWSRISDWLTCLLKNLDEYFFRVQRLARFFFLDLDWFRRMHPSERSRFFYVSTSFFYYGRLEKYKEDRVSFFYLSRESESPSSLEEVLPMWDLAGWLRWLSYILCLYRLTDKQFGLNLLQYMTIHITKSCFLCSPSAPFQKSPPFGPRNISTLIF